MPHVRVDDQLKAEAADALASLGLTLSDAVRILLTRVAAEDGMPARLGADLEVHDAWFRAKAREALANPHATKPHDQVMHEARALIDGKRRA